VTGRVSSEYQLNKKLDFSEIDRKENIRRAAEIA
jgi:adenylylsulfate kinase-like enzyme